MTQKSVQGYEPYPSAAVSGEYSNLNQEKEQSLDGTVLIFGQGPVIIEPQERINYWSEDLAQAAAVLKKYDQRVKHFIVMGGKTAGPEHSSEAQLIAQKMGEFGVDSDIIFREEQSNDTIENIVNFLNLFDTPGEIKSQKFSILCAPYHSARIQVLLQLFKVPVDQVFQSTEVLRFSARVPENERQITLDSSKWDNHLLQTIDDKVDMNDPTKYSSQQSEQERRDVADRFVKDDLWTRELLEFPEKWLPYVGRLSNSQRVQAILEQVDTIYPGMLAEKYDIDLSKDDHDVSLADVREKLLQIPAYKGLSSETVKKWEDENKTVGWPAEPRDRLEKLLELRQLSPSN
ncbi:hypothetical protein BH09PAT1_BH09PAT1_6620 [soil metagenome]